MAVICDICGTNCTPEISGNEDLSFNFEKVNLNGTLHLCGDCYLALSEYIRSNDFKKVLAEYKKKREMDE